MTIETKSKGALVNQACQGLIFVLTFVFLVLLHVAYFDVSTPILCMSMSWMEVIHCLCPSPESLQRFGIPNMV